MPSRRGVQRERGGGEVNVEDPAHQGGRTSGPSRERCPECWVVREVAAGIAGEDARAYRLRIPCRPQLGPQAVQYGATGMRVREADHPFMAASRATGAAEPTGRGDDRGAERQ